MTDEELPLGVLFLLERLYDGLREETGRCHDAIEAHAVEVVGA